jgi:hypothetical protein
MIMLPSPYASSLRIGLLSSGHCALVLWGAVPTVAEVFTLGPELVCVGNSRRDDEECRSLGSQGPGLQR